MMHLVLAFWTGEKKRRVNKRRNVAFVWEGKRDHNMKMKIHLPPKTNECPLNNRGKCSKGKELVFQFPTSNYFFLGRDLLLFGVHLFLWNWLIGFGIIWKGWNFFQSIVCRNFSGGFLTCTTYLEPCAMASIWSILQSPKTNFPTNSKPFRHGTLGRLSLKSYPPRDAACSKDFLREGLRLPGWLALGGVCRGWWNTTQFFMWVVHSVIKLLTFFRISRNLRKEQPGLISCFMSFLRVCVFHIAHILKWSLPYHGKCLRPRRGSFGCAMIHIQRVFFQHPNI